MYDELQKPFTVRWARDAGFGAKSLLRLQQAGLVVPAGRKLMLIAATAELVAATAVGPLVALGWLSAARWYGWPMLVEPTLIELVVPGRRCPTPVPGTRIIRQPLAPSEVVRIRGVPVTSPMRTALDLAMKLPVFQAVPILDAACRLGGVRLSALRRTLVALGSPKARLVARLVDPSHESVYESLFFLLVISSRLPEPSSQHKIFRRGRFVGRADFAWPECKLIVEIDGYEYHSSRAAFNADRRRQNAMVNAGWRVLRFTPSDLNLRPHEVLDELREELGLSRSTLHESAFGRD